MIVVLAPGYPSAWANARPANFTGLEWKGRERETMDIHTRPKPDTRRPFFELSARRLVFTLGLAGLVASIVQLFLGASVIVVALAVLSMTFGLLGFLSLGAYNVGAWMALFYVFGNVTIPLYAKTLMGQPIDSYLYTPECSFLVLAVASAALLIALLMVRWIGVGQPVFRGEDSYGFLSFLSWSCFVLGFVFGILNRIFQGPSGDGFGGVAFFQDLLLMAVIARTAMLLEKSGDRRSLDGKLTLIMAASVFMGLLNDHKTDTALPVVSYFATLLFYRRGLSRRAVLVLITGGALFVAVVAPTIHVLRALGEQQMSLGQRVSFVINNFPNLVTHPDEFNSVTAQFANYYYDYFGGNGTGQMLLGRYASVQQIDPVIASVNARGPRGGSAVWPALFRLLPSFISPNKPKFTEAYQTLVYYGLIDPRGGKYPTLPLAGQSYAAYGVPGLLVIPFVTFFGFLLVIKKLGWNLHRNVYAIFFFCDFVVVYANQGELGQYAGATLRNFPMYAAVFLLVKGWYRLFLLDRHRAHRTAFWGVDSLSTTSLTVANHPYQANAILDTDDTPSVIEESVRVHAHHQVSFKANHLKR
jgi:hypothetical protein